MGKDLGELLSEATEKPRRRCWAARIADPRAAEFLSALRGRDFVVAKVTLILREEFGIIACKESVREHLRGLCSCGRQRE